jgi:hypothetical protein
MNLGPLHPKRSSWLLAALLTNAMEVDSSPRWLTEAMVTRAAAKVESRLEWSLHRVKGIFYKTPEEFQKIHGHPGAPILAFYRQQTKDIHFGPLVTKENFESTFAHELAHVVVAQKYKDHLPKWLEEGLANSTADKNDVDWVAVSKIFPRMDPRQAAHPFSASEFADVQNRYLISLAALQFLKKECPSFRELLNLGLKSNLETYLPTYCKIQDLNAQFWSFVDRKVKRLGTSAGS